MNLKPYFINNLINRDIELTAKTLLYWSEFGFRIFL